MYDIEINNLNYQYNDKFKALDNINLKVPTGSIYGFLGPNGAGKSTTMALIAGLLKDDSSAIKVYDKSINKHGPELYLKMGCLIEIPALYYNNTGYEHLLIIAKANALSTAKIDHYLKMVGIYERRHTKVKTYSLGMRQRLSIAMALLKEPQLLILDEPVNGLDPNGMAEIRELLVELNQEHGKTIFVSSHLLAEIEKMCTHIGIIHRGKMQFEGTIEELKSTFETFPIRIQTISTQQLNGLEKIGNMPITILDENHISLPIKHKEDIPRLIKEMVELNLPIYNVQQEGNLESWFLNLTK